MTSVHILSSGRNPGAADGPSVRHRMPLHLGGLPDDLHLAVVQNLEPLALLRFCSCSKRHAALPTEELWRAHCVRLLAPYPRYRLTPEREQQFVQAHPTSWLDRLKRMKGEIERTTINGDEMIGLTWFFNFTHAAGGRGKSTVVRVHFDGSYCQLPNYPRLPYALHSEASTCSWERGLDEARAEAGTRPQSSEGAVSGADGSGGGGGGESRRGPGRALSALRSMLSLHEMPKPDFEDSMDLEVPRQQFVQIANFPPHWVRRLSDGEWLIYNDNVTIVSCVGDEPGGYDDRGFLSEPDGIGSDW